MALCYVILGLINRFTDTDNFETITSPTFIRHIMIQDEVSIVRKERLFLQLSYKNIMILSIIQFCNGILYQVDIGSERFIAVNILFFTFPSSS